MIVVLLVEQLPTLQSHNTGLLCDCSAIGRTTVYNTVT